MTEAMWSREEVQRVLYHVVRQYQMAQSPSYSNGKSKKMPRRFGLFGRRLPFLGGDSELLRSAIYDVAIPTLRDNNWWPDD
jgi:hypothetical protein